MLLKAQLSILISPIFASVRRRSWKTCPVLISSENTSNLIYEDVLCYDTWCCADGCCPWYINFAGGLAIFCLFIISWKLIEKCWHKYCRDVSTTEQENMVMLNHSTSASRQDLVNYGSYASEETILSHREDGRPKYEEVAKK